MSLITKLLIFFLIFDSCLNFTMILMMVLQNEVSDQNQKLKDL